jgi:hypothetical protein
MIQGIHGIDSHFQSLVFSEANTFEKVQVQTDFSWSLNPALTETTGRNVVYVFHPLPTLGRHRQLPIPGYS